MGLALRLAKKAWQRNEVPVGAVVVSAEGMVIGRGWNQSLTRCDPSAHAEIVALRKAAKMVGNYRLAGTSLYATIEPCPMCMGAIVQARVARLIFGAADPKWGAAGTLYNLARDGRLNHQVEVIPGICEEACRHLIQDFFRQRRG
jgi:tRNA(adenine34) deaminase